MSIAESTEVLIEAYGASGKTEGFGLIQVPQFIEELFKLNLVDLTKGISKRIYQILEKAPESLVQTVKNCVGYVVEIKQVEEEIGPI